MRRDRTVLWLAAGLWLLYLTTSSGGFENSDTVLRYLTAKSWLDGRGGTLPPELGWDGGAVLPDGRVYAFFGPLQSVLMVPFLAIVDALPALGGTDRSVVETFAVSLGLFPLVSTAALVLSFLALRTLGFGRGESLQATLAIGVGSLFWHYARMGQEEHLLGLGYAVWLYGAARLAAGRPFPAMLMAAGAAVCLATRWASVAPLAVVFVLTLVLLARFRRNVEVRDLVLGALIIAVTAALLLLYNHARFGDWLQTGYPIWYAHQGERMFRLDGYAGHLAALVASPYRGLLFYSPVVIAAAAGAFATRPGAQRVLAFGGLAVLAASLLFFAAFRFWTAGHSWGPRFLASPHVLLVPALAALFARFPRSVSLVPLLAALQIFSTVLPASTEEYVWHNIERRTPGFCNPWRVECTAIAQRIPRSLRALANTAANRPGVVLSGRPVVAAEKVLATSDYRTLYWWPVRIAFRLGRLSAAAALALCLAGLASSAAALALAWRSTREAPGNG